MKVKENRRLLTIIAVVFSFFGSLYTGEKGVQRDEADFTTAAGCCYQLTRLIQRINKVCSSPGTYSDAQSQFLLGRYERFKQRIKSLSAEARECPLNFLDLFYQENLPLAGERFYEIVDDLAETVKCDRNFQDATEKI
jgi:hypothetical protein